MIKSIPDILIGTFTGSASELIELLQLKDSITPNVITKLLNQHIEFLKKHGILYRYKRTRDKRLIQLECDSSDSGDGICPPAE